MAYDHYLGEDPVSGRYRYYDFDAGLSKLSDAPPTAAQSKQYKADQADNAVAQAEFDAKYYPTPSRSTADTIEKQAKVTAIANGYVSKSNDVVGTAEVVVNRATPTEYKTGLRLGDAYTTPEKSLANASNKSALITQKVAIDKQIIANKDFLTKYAQSSDPAINSARQQVQTSTLQLQTTYAKINETLATIDGASTQILATSAPATPTQDTASRDITNTTSPATVAAGTSKLPTNQLSNLKKLAGSNNNLGVVPTVSDKIEPAITGVNSVGNKFIAGAQSSAQTPTADPDAVDLSKVIPNVLHGYASYTYGLSLHLLTSDEYNTITKKGEYVPKRVLIASAGRYNNTPGPNQFIRSPKFAEDFYFDKFELETVIGLNAESRSSNAVKYDFTLIEPYGFTLIDRIIDLTTDPAEGVNCKNYMDMPYLLQIDFFGMDDTGAIIGAIPNTTKRIPIRLNKMDVRISARGAEYAIKGVPYGHSAFDLTTISTPIDIEVEAKTVAEFFQSVESAGGATDTSGQREAALSRLWATTDGGLIGPDGQPNQINPSLLSIQTKRELGLITSFGTALNKFQRQAFVDNKISVNDEYYFNFLDPLMANSTFTSGAFTNPKDTGMVAVDKTNSIKKSDLGFNTNDYNSNKRIFQVNAGTYIDQVIAWVIRNSTWMTDQVIVPDGANPLDYLRELKAKKDTPLYWFKVIPSIELGKFDNRRNIWSRKITYHIQKYEVTNIKVDVGPDARAKNPVKAYNYIYTGKNDDILDLDIQFNTLYYNALTIYRSALTNVVQPPDPTEEGKTDNPGEYTGSSDPTNSNPNAIMPLVNKIQVIDARSRTGSGSDDARQVTVADLQDSLLTLSQADMLHVKLKILGDPSFIKQDDIFWTPKSNTQVSENQTNADTRLTPDGSLKTDNGQVIVSLTFRTPTDIDESTGMMNFNSKTFKTKVSLFSGLYRVIKVTNEFRNGQFTQTLDLVRLVKQGRLDNNSNKPSISDNRNSVPGQSAILDNYMRGPDFNTPDAPKIAQAVDDAAQSAQQAQENNRDNTAPNTRTSAEDNLVELRALAPEEPISETNLLTAVPPGPAPSSPAAATAGSVFDGISAADVQYIRSQSAALGLNPSALNGYLTNRLQDYEPNLRAKVASDVVKLKEILRKRNQ